jgi:undecaprenyl-diphosphatase
MILGPLLLGIVQGLTEFIPVSSTAHLIIIPYFLGWSGTIDTLEFDVALHGGTLLALLISFRKEWLSILRGNRNLLLALGVGTAPAAVAGLTMEEVVESTLRNPWIIASSLVIISIFMLLAERVRTNRDFGSITVKDAFIIGIAQAVALVPGVSRSGITISAGLLRRIDRVSAARYSFVLSMPVVAGAVVLEGTDILKAPGEFDYWQVLIGFFTSFVSGLLCIRFLLWFFQRFSLKVFVYYRFALAGIILLLLWIQG